MAQEGVWLSRLLFGAVFGSEVRGSRGFRGVRGRLVGAVGGAEGTSGFMLSCPIDQ